MLILSIAVVFCALGFIFNSVMLSRMFRNRISILKETHAIHIMAVNEELKIQKAISLNWEQGFNRLSRQTSEVTSRLVKACSNVDQSCIKPTIPDDHRFSFYRSDPDVFQYIDGGDRGDIPVHVEHGELKTFRFEVGVFVPHAPIEVRQNILLGAVMAHGALMFKDALLSNSRR